MTNEQYIQQLKILMELKGNTPGTIRVYRITLQQFFEFVGKHAEDITTEDIMEYLHFYIKKDYASRTVNGKHAILVIFFKQVMRRPDIMYPIPYMRTPKELPTILTRDEINALFEASKNLRIKAMLMTIYSAGLRVGEVTRLKVSDIDSTKMQVRILQSKGRKDRYTVLSERTLECLRAYYKQYQPEDWLFYPRGNKATSISVRTVQEHFQNTVKAAGITHKVSTHSLRHSFASHLLEDDVNIYAIMTLLGHCNLRATQVYLRLTPSKLYSLKSPLDQGVFSNE